MGSKHKQSRMEQKASFERWLEDRLSPRIDKDVIVKKLRADINAVNVRLKSIAEIEKKTEELTRNKAEKKAAPLEDQEGGKHKKSKEVPAEGKEKKKKKEDNNSEKSE
jgi:hypothetical protein